MTSMLQTVVVQWHAVDVLELARLPAIEDVPDVSFGLLRNQTAMRRKVESNWNRMIGWAHCFFLSSIMARNPTIVLCDRMRAARTRP